MSANKKILLSTSEVTFPCAHHPKHGRTEYCFILEKGNLRFISEPSFCLEFFNDVSSRHPATIIEKFFGRIEEAMDIFQEAKYQGALYYNGNFVRIDVTN